MASPAYPTISPPDPRQRRRASGLAGLLGVGALGVVLALVQSDLFDLDRHAAAKELALHLTALLGLVVLLPRWRRVEAGAVELMLAAFLTWSAVTALLATNHWLAFRSWSVTFSGFVIFLMAREAARQGRGRMVAAGLAFAAVIGALTGLAQAYGLDWSLLAGERAPGGTFGNRNFMAHLLAIALPLVALITLEAEHRWTRALGLAGSGLIAAAVVLTRSRAAWLAMGASWAVIGLALLVIRRAADRPVLARRPAGLLAALALGTGLALLLPNRLEWKSDSPYAESLKGIVNYQEGSGHGRLIQYRNTLGLVARDPVFGVGPGNWMVRYPQVTTPGDPSFGGADPIPTNPWPSSDWMAFWAERGMVGVLLLLGAGLAAAVTAWRRLHQPGQALASVALLGCLTAAMVAGLFDAVLLLAAPTLFVFAAVGALLPPSGTVVAAPLRRRSAALAAAGLVALLVVLRSAGELTAIALTSQGRQRAVLERASQFDPGNHRLHLYLAMRGSCAQRLPHARAARRLLPFHDWPRRAEAACGETTGR